MNHETRHCFQYIKVFQILISVSCKRKWVFKITVVHVIWYRYLLNEYIQEKCRVNVIPPV